MYCEKFSTSSFLDGYHRFSSQIPGVRGRIIHQLEFYHDAFQSIPSGVRILDYGAGPSIMPCISSVTKASEIILADYTESNLKALSQWLNGDHDAFDWSPHFEYVIRQLEGKKDEDLKERQEKVRKTVKAVVHCDLTKDPPIHECYKEFDVVITSLVAEIVATNLDELTTYLERIGRLVKPGGTLLYYGVENRLGYYEVGDIRFPNMHATAEFVMNALKGAGFHHLCLRKYEPANDPNRAFRAISGVRTA